jgi:hypothetical protein
MLTADWERVAPLTLVDVTYGPSVEVGRRALIWWQVDARAGEDEKAAPLFSVRCLTERDPLATPDGALNVVRYALRPTATGPALEYVDSVSHMGLLPAWRDFERLFLPRASAVAKRRGEVPETATFLGHTLSLHSVTSNVAWGGWDDVKRLELNRELLVGTGRNFRDSELKRLPQTPQKQNYNYVRFTRDEYKTMIDAGINLYWVDAEQWIWERDEPAFLIRSPDQGNAKAPGPAIQFPVDLYRANYLGPVMFMDEPAILMIGDPHVNKTLQTFADATTLLAQRVRARYQSGGSYSAFELESALKKAGVNFGAMRLEQWDYPAWETIYPTAQYQLAAGVSGIIHEARYQLPAFDERIGKWIDKPKQHTAEELLRYHNAFLRGGARATGKFWGTSVYGQMDPKISPLACTMAYDMGARYVWFWTSDHGHHVPWPEQLELSRHLKAHAAAHPRPSIYSPPRELDRAIVIPDGYWLELGSLRWMHGIDAEMTSEPAKRFSAVMRGAHAAIERALEAHEDFDVLVDMAGQKLPPYRNVERITDEVK